eukprot:299845-Ditylum_brightwellii.AAC.1
MHSTSVIKGRNSTTEFNYTQRIRLPRKCKFQWASNLDGDKIFHGKRGVVYQGSSTFLHVELLVNTGDNYCPEERILDPSLMAPPNQ